MAINFIYCLFTFDDYLFSMRIYHQTSVARAKKYFEVSDYYEGQEQLKGHWIGKGAEYLGLDGEVDKKIFDRLCDNLHPTEDKRLTLANNAKRRALSDITLSVPKSVSILYAVGSDGDRNGLLNAFSTAANQTFKDFEQDALTRVNHKHGQLSTKPTGNLIAASWIHLTSRPVEDLNLGTHPDPQLHIHFATINATHTGKNRWTAVDLSNIVRDSGYFEAQFQSRLATNLKQLGYGIQRTKHNFEIDGISRETIKKFSRRSDEIDQLIDQGVADKIAAKEKISIRDAMDKVGARSRLSKSDNYSIEELPKVWQSRLDGVETEQLSKVIDREISQRPPTVTKEMAVDFAQQHRFQNESVTRERQLLRDALLHGIGDLNSEQIHAEVAKRDWIRQGEGADALISTKEVLAEEQALLKFARSGRGQCQPLAANHAITRDWLSEEQKNSVLGLLSSTDRLQVLRGVAGSGKTTLMSEAISGIERAGTSVTVLAPGVQAAHEVLAEEGFDANTLASFLLDKRSQDAARGSVIWVDEAGQSSMPEISKLAKVAKDIDARIILSGDKRQHKSVARGAPLKLLESEAGIVPQEVTKIRRQKGLYGETYRKAVSNLSEGNVYEGFNQLDSLDFVHEIEGDERYQKIAEQFADNFEAHKKTLVIAPTHAERAIATEAIRAEMKARGHIHSDDRTFDILKSKRLTEAQRSDSLNYQENDVIEFVKRGKGGFKPGDRLRVMKVDGEHVYADSTKGIVEVPRNSPGSFDVYQWHSTNFAIGDNVRVTKRNKKQNLYNGTMATIDGFTEDGSLKLSNGKIINPDWGHVENGISVTSHASQGKTYDRVLVAQSSLSFPASSPEQMYVTASRGVERIDIFTDDVEGLREAISKSRPQLMASELATSTKKSALSRQMDNLRIQSRQFVQRQIRRARELFNEQKKEAPSL
ncbi:MAG: MobF family relaxase [Planctomycetota bacterium]